MIFTQIVHDSTLELVHYTASFLYHEIMSHNAIMKVITSTAKITENKNLQDFII